MEPREDRYPTENVLDERKAVVKVVMLMELTEILAQLRIVSRKGGAKDWSVTVGTRTRNPRGIASTEPVHNIRHCKPAFYTRWQPWVDRRTKTMFGRVK